MTSAFPEVSRVERPELRGETDLERWRRWPVHWSAVIVGALAAIAAGALFSLAGVALGAHLLAPEQRGLDLKQISMVALALSVFGAFLSFVIGGWVAGRIGGFLLSEPAMLHGAIAWLVAVPLSFLLATLCAGSLFGGMAAGLAGTPAGATTIAAPFDRPLEIGPNASAQARDAYEAERAEYLRKVREWREVAPRAARNSALGAITVMILGLVGSVIGGWMASGEPMTLTYYRTRAATR